MKHSIILQMYTYTCTNTFLTRGRPGSGVYKAVCRDKAVVLKVIKGTASVLCNRHWSADDLTPIHEGPFHDVVCFYCNINNQAHHLLGQKKYREVNITNSCKIIRKFK